MSLKELKAQRVLLPEELWGDRPASAEGGRFSALVTGAIGVASGLLIWFGNGSFVTFLGLGLFLLDLALFLIVGFAAVDRHVQRLSNLGLRGKVEGLDLEGGGEL